MPRPCLYKNNLKAILKKKKWTYKVFAEKMGRPDLYNSVKNWTNNRNQPTPENTKLILETLGIPPDKLFFFS